MSSTGGWRICRRICILFLHCSFMFDNAGMEAVAKSSLVDDGCFVFVFGWWLWWQLFSLSWFWSSSSSLLSLNWLMHLKDPFLLWSFLRGLPPGPDSSFMELKLSFMRPSTASAIVAGAFVPRERIKCFLFYHTGELSKRNENKTGGEQWWQHTGMFFSSSSVHSLLSYIVTKLSALHSI